jgi:hypothetical protein
LVGIDIGDGFLFLGAHEFLLRRKLADATDVFGVVNWSIRWSSLPFELLGNLVDVLGLLISGHARYPHCAGWHLWCRWKYQLSAEHGLLSLLGNSGGIGCGIAADDVASRSRF